MLRCRLLLPALSLLALALFADAGQPQPAKDLHGDPLPPGAIARMGQDRWLHGIIANFAAFLPDGKTVVTVNSDNTIRVWEFPSGKEIRRIALSGSGVAGEFRVGPGFSGGRAAPLSALNADGKTIATSAERGEIWFYDLDTGKKLPMQVKMPGEEANNGKGKALILSAGVAGLAFSPDGKQLATIGERGEVILWDWANGQQVRKINNGGNPDSFDFHVAYAPDGKTLVTVHLEDPPMAMNEVAIVRFWNPTTGDKIHSVTIDPKDFIDDLCLAFSPDCKTLAITAGPIVALVDSATGKQVGQLGQINEKAGKAPFMETFSAVFSKDGSKVYTSGYPSTIMEWDFATRKLLRESDRDYGPGALALARDGKTLVVTGRGPIFYDLKEGQKIQAINTLTQPLQSLQYLSDGKTLLTSAAVGPGARGPSQQWDASSGKDLGTFKTSPVSSGYFAISPDGKIVAGLSKSAKAKKNKEPTNFVICDVVTGKELHQIPLQLGEFAIGMCFSPDSKSIVLAQPEKQKIELYDVATAKLIRPLASISSSPVTAKGKKSIQKQSMLFSPDGKLFAWSENRNPPSLSLIDVTTGKQIGTLALTAGPNLEGFGVTISPGLLASRLDRAAFSPDGRCLALDMEDGTAVLYELATGQPRIAFGKKLPLPKAPGKGEFEAAMVLLNSQTKARTCFAISPDGRRFAHAGADGVVHICDVLTGKELKEFKGHGEGVNALAFAPNGKTLASASADSTALIWDVSKIDRPATPPKSLKTAELEAWWQDMAGNDATKAFAAMSNLIAGPKDAAVWIKDRVKPAAPVDTKRAEELLAQLDSNQYKVRELANAELLRMGEQVVPLINKALAATPPLETKQRLELLRGKLTDTVLRGEQLRAHRAVEVLELIGTPEARQVLQELANGAPEARLTSSAQAALNR